MGVHLVLWIFFRNFASEMNFPPRVMGMGLRYCEVLYLSNTLIY